jgi:predicted alpha-1,6-mannanase (GH76 family)
MIHIARISRRVSLSCVAAFVFAGYTPGSAVTRADADQAYNAWFNLYFNKSNNTFFKRDSRTGLIDFWRYAHDWETILDRYELTRDPALLATLKDTWIGFNRNNGTGYDWKRNNFNDDIEWWIISSTRAYLLTQDTTYLNTAKRSFDWLYSTQFDNTLGGGIWWKNTEKGSKNACSNGPAARGALNLYAITKDASYLDKAKAIYTWEKNTLFRSNGSVSDNIRPGGQPSGGALFYNQGTFLGPAMELFRITGDSAYYKDGIKAIEYVRTSMSNRTTGILNGGSNTGDGAAFLVIFIRNIMDVIMHENQTQYLGWMKANADAAWNNRRQTDNIMSSNFGSPAAASGLESSSSTGGVAMVTLAVLASQPMGINIQGKNPFARKPRSLNVVAFSIDGRMAPGVESSKPTLLLQRASNGEVVERINLR